MTAIPITPRVDAFSTRMVRAQGDYDDIWGPEQQPLGRAQRWMRERLAIAGRGSLGNRFADPGGSYRETYTARRLTGALVELWAADVPDEATLVAANNVHQAGWDAPYDPAELPPSSLDLFVWTLCVEERFKTLDVRQTETRTWLRRTPALHTALSRARVGAVLSSGVLEGDGPRSRIATQAIGRHTYSHPDGFHGITYRSRHGNGEDAYAVFDKCTACVLDKRPLDPEEADAVEAARRLGLYIAKEDA